MHPSSCCPGAPGRFYECVCASMHASMHASAQAVHQISVDKSCVALRCVALRCVRVSVRACLPACTQHVCLYTCTCALACLCLIEYAYMPTLVCQLVCQLLCANCCASASACMRWHACADMHASACTHRLASVHVGVCWCLEVVKAQLLLHNTVQQLLNLELALAHLAECLPDLLLV